MEKNRKNFLDKVVEFLVKDTKVDYDSRELFFPFTLKKSLRQNSDNSTPFHKMIFNRDSIIPRDGFMEYIDEMYGVSSIEEISYVWGKYKDVMRYNVFGNDPTNEPIYESEKGSINEDSRQDLIDKVDERVKKYLDKVVDFILKETVIDFGIDKFNPVIKDEVLWYPPFSERPYSHRQSMYNTGANYDFDNYCQEVFSIFDEGEQLYVWEKYRKLLGFKMRNMMINESDDRRKNFLDKVVDFIVKDTSMEYSVINYVSYPWDPETPLLFNSQTDLKYSHDYFREYVIETYGLTLMDEVLYVWEELRRKIGEKLFTGDTINESDDKRQKYLDKILKWFVDDTMIDYGTGVIVYPFSPIGPTGKPLPSFIDDLKNKLSWGMSSDVQITCRDTYGLNYDETKYIWDKYKTIIKDRYNKESIMYDLKPINESDDKRQVFLNKIIDWLVSDTDVDGLWFNPPYKTGLIYAENSITLSSLYKQTFNLLKYVTDEEEVKFVIQMNYFKRFCKEQYGLTEEEITYVWEGYMKNLYESEKYNSLNESDDKRQKYLDKVINWMVEDTVIDWKEERVRFPYLSDYNFGFSQIPFSTLGGPPTTPVIEYCKYRYGLLSDEIDYVWGFYKDIILDKYEKESKLRDFNDINFYDMMNESEDKKQVYLDKIVDWLVRDTEVNVKQSWINPPYYYPGSSAGRTGFRLLYEHTFGLLKNTSYSGLDTQLIYFNGYCKNNYGLTEDETTIVWRQYMRKLYDSYEWGVY